MKRAYLSLGSNLGDRERHLRAALEALEPAGIHLLRASSLYETEPQDLPGQPWFLNLVAEVETRLFPRQLLHALQGIERALGRKRGIAKGPRIIDIDIVLFGNFVIDTPELKIPHAGMTERRFVLEPLAEMVPGLRHPVLRKTVRELLGAIRGQAVRSYEPPR